MYLLFDRLPQDTLARVFEAAVREHHQSSQLAWGYSSAAEGSASSAEKAREIDCRQFESEGVTLHKRLHAYFLMFSSVGIRLQRAAHERGGHVSWSRGDEARSALATGAYYSVVACGHHNNILSRSQYQNMYIHVCCSLCFFYFFAQAYAVVATTSPSTPAPQPILGSPSYEVQPLVSCALVLLCCCARCSRMIAQERKIAKYRKMNESRCYFGSCLLWETACILCAAFAGVQCAHQRSRSRRSLIRSSIVQVFHFNLF